MFALSLDACEASKSPAPLAGELGWGVIAMEGSHDDHGNRLSRREFLAGTSMLGAATLLGRRVRRPQSRLRTKKNRLLHTPRLPAPQYMAKITALGGSHRWSTSRAIQLSLEGIAAGEATRDVGRAGTIPKLDRANRSSFWVVSTRDVMSCLVKADPGIKAEGKTSACTAWSRRPHSGVQHGGY